MQTLANWWERLSSHRAFKTVERLEGLWSIWERIPGILKVLLRLATTAIALFIVPRLVATWGWIDQNPIDSLLIFVAVLATVWASIEALLARGRIRNIHHPPPLSGELPPPGGTLVTRKVQDTLSLEHRPSPDDDWVHLAVVNHGKTDAFEAEVTGLDGGAKHQPTPWFIKWRQGPQSAEERRIRAGRDALLDFAEGDATNIATAGPDVNWKPGVFWFYSTTARWDVQLGGVRSWADMFTNKLRVTVEIAGIEHGASGTWNVELGFDNQTTAHPTVSISPVSEGHVPGLSDTDMAEVSELIRRGRRVQRRLAKGFEIAYEKELSTWRALAIVTLAQQDRSATVAAFNSARNPRVPLQDPKMSAHQLIKLNENTAQIEVLENLLANPEPASPTLVELR